MIDGTIRADRVTHNEPMPGPAESLDPPTKMDTHGRAFWNYHAPRLQKLNLLTECDTYSLAQACEWWSIHQRALNGLRKSLVQVSEANVRCSRPEVGIAKHAFACVRQIMQGFGLDPQSRSKISVTPSEEQKDPIGDLYFKRPRPVAV